MQLSIPEKYQNIGILFSGGMDSSLLLYMIGKQYHDRNLYAFSSRCMYFTHGRQLDAVNTVFQKIVTLLPQNTINYHLTYEFEYDRETHKSNQAMIDFSDMIDVWVTGTNMAPPLNSMIDDKHGIEHDLHESCEMEHRKSPLKTWSLSQNASNEYYLPFASCHKQDIARLYKKFEIHETILPFTRSCCQRYSEDEMHEFVMHCDDCWFCLERKWGLKVLEK